MFNRRNSRKHLLIFLSVMLAAQACINQEDFEFDNLAGIKASPSVAVPLMHGSLTIEDILPLDEVENVKKDEDGLIRLVYSDTLRYTSIYDHFLLPQLNLDLSYPMKAGALIPGDRQIVIEDKQILDLSFQDSDFEEIHLKGGKVQATASSEIESEIKLIVNFPTLKKGGVPLSFNITLPKGNKYKQVNTETELQGYKIDLSEYGAGENHIPVDIRAEINQQNNDIIDPTDELQIDLEIGGLKFQLLTGHLGQPIVELPKSEIPISVFENLFTNGKFGLKAPMLSFEVLNSNGAPLKVTTNLLQARNSQEETLDIRLNPASPIDISYPTVIGSTSNTKLEILNVGEIIDLAPTAIDYQLSGQLNMTTAAGMNFLTDSSKLAVVLNADVPLWGYLEGLNLSDTLEMALDFKDADVKEGSLRLTVENEFPLEAQLQIEFINDNYDILETLFTGDYQTLLPASKVNAEGDLVTAGKYTGGDIIITSERFERILKSTKMIVKAKLFTSRNSDGSQPHVKIKSTQKLNVNLGVQATANITVEL